jgi:plastocyanin
VFATPAHAATLTIQAGANGNTYTPNTLTITTGDSVTWDMVTSGHDIDGQGFGTALAKQPAGTQYTHTFNTAGTQTYRCDFHYPQKALVEQVLARK